MRVNGIAVFFLALATGSGAELKPKTERAYQAYLSTVEKNLDKRDGFLIIDSVTGLRNRVKNGEIFVEERRPSEEPPEGLVHHYEGAAFIPKVTLKQVIEFVQKYDNHKKVYSPEVMDSKILKREGNNFVVRLRLLKKKILTVVLETEHEVHYKPIDATKWESRSRTTKVAEVENPGTAREKEHPSGHGYGFVWHLDTYWRFLEADGGVYIECTSISLSRDIPLGMGRVLRPIVEELPEESLRNVLKNTRNGLK